MTDLLHALRPITVQCAITGNWTAHEWSYDRLEGCDKAIAMECEIRKEEDRGCSR